MPHIERELVDRFQKWYLETYDDKLSTREAETKLREVAVVLRATKIKRKARKSGK